MRAEARKQMARMKEKAMSALNLPQLSPVGETLFQLKTEPQLSPTNCSVVSGLISHEVADGVFFFPW